MDWDCEVIKNYSDINLGCAKRVSSGIDWVFNHVEEAIILEDDCLPHPTFFPFCEELLEKYRYDTRVSSISGKMSCLGAGELITVTTFHDTTSAGVGQAGEELGNITTST